MDWPSLSSMTKTLRVVLEIGKKRRVVAGAMDWPGLDRWGTSEDDALEKLLSYVPRYVQVAERAGLGSAFERARDAEVVERVPGSSSTDFWGIAHVPSEVEREVLPADALERRLRQLGGGKLAAAQALGGRRQCERGEVELQAAPLTR